MRSMRDKDLRLSRAILTLPTPYFDLCLHQRVADSSTRTAYCVSTVGLDEAMIKEYIQNQEKLERDQERGLFD